MPIRRYTIDPPFLHQAGDVYARSGGSLLQIRGGVVVDTRVVGQGSLLTTQEHVGGAEVAEFFEEQKMAGTMTTLVGVNRSGDIIRFRFANGTEREFPDLATALSQTEYLDTDVTVGENALILKSLRNSPDGANLETMVGKSFAADFNNATQPLSLIGE